MVAPSSGYDYSAAVSRNIGWLEPDEQAALRRKRVAIAGLGGVGGSHLLTLARLGIGAFSIADFDTYAVHNLNRQAGAFCSTIGVPKINAAARMALDVNPELDLRRFPEGVLPANVDAFLRDVDVYVDGIDFFSIEARRMIFAACRERGIPALTAAPLGMGTALLYFPPRGMSFERYFRVEGHERQEQLARFIAGLSPAMLQRTYLVVPGAVDFAGQSGPSTVMACDLCAGVTGVAVLKVLLGRGTVRPAPWVMHFDAYRQKLRISWRPGGNANPLQRLLLMLIRPRLNMG